MPVSLKSAFKYPLLAKTQVINKSLDSSSLRNEMYTKDDPLNYYVGTGRQAEQTPVAPLNKVEYQSAIDSESMNEYELIDKVLNNSKCLTLLKAILMSDSKYGFNVNPLTNITFDDVLKYLILIGILVIIYKTLLTF